MLARAVVGFTAQGRSRVDWSRVPLGELSDGWLAWHLGVTAQAVHFQRVRRGIPPYEFGARRALCKYVREIILGSLLAFEAHTFSEIHQAVLDDYGSIQDRQVHRHLAILVSRRQIRRVLLDEDDPRYTGFVRTGYLRNRAQARKER
jgi:hypothetical protein